MPKVSVEIPQKSLNEPDEHVGDDKKSVGRSDAIRSSTQKTMYMFKQLDNRYGSVDTPENEEVNI
jgi:Arc/MetJ-type ribon-helix-helix transcriptional regulator